MGQIHILKGSVESRQPSTHHHHWIAYNSVAITLSLKSVTKTKKNKILNHYEDVDCHYVPCKMEEDLAKLMKSYFFGKTCEDMDEEG